MKAIVIAILCLFSTSLWAAPVSVENAYVRLLPPTQKVTGAFMVFKNNTDTDRAVVSAQSDVAEKTELHTHLHENGVMKMRQVDKIDVPAGGQTVLKPGGFHVMLIGLKKPLSKGQKVEIRFTFDDGSSARVQAEVKSVKGGMKMSGSGMQNMKTDTGSMPSMSGPSE